MRADDKRDRWMMVALSVACPAAAPFMLIILAVEMWLYWRNS